ncbi:MAG: flagellar biosynthesis repressor FlbT [Salaquimonas sp.]|nr:flagellar biosynthesis repressor FlbT [Salaquimonas sp.]
MSNMRLYLRPGEKLYINGAVIRVDRKVSIELLNDVTFLLENHVLQSTDATTPVRQVYFVVQMMLMDPVNTEKPMELFASVVESLKQAVNNEELIDGICSVEQDVQSGRTFNALKTLRHLFEVEDRILASRSRPQQADPEPAWDLNRAQAKQIGA